MSRNTIREQYQGLGAMVLLAELNASLARIERSAEHLRGDIDAFKPDDPTSYMTWRELRTACKKQKVPCYTKLGTRQAMMLALRKGDGTGGAIGVEVGKSR